MAYSASVNAIKNANIDSNVIDMIIVATTTPERKFPSTAVLLQNKLKNNKAFPSDPEGRHQTLSLSPSHKSSGNNGRPPF